MSVFSGDICGKESTDYEVSVHNDQEEASLTVLMSEIGNELLINRKIRTAGIVKEVDIINEEITMQYEMNEVRVFLGESKVLKTLEKGRIVEIVGRLIKKYPVKGDSREDHDEINKKELIIDADIIRIIDGMDLYLYQVSILLRRKVIGDSSHLTFNNYL